MDIVILTGSEIRHTFFRRFLSNQDGINVLLSVCESDSMSLLRRMANKTKSSKLEISHANDRLEFEKIFFQDYNSLAQDSSNPVSVERGAVNDDKVVQEIIKLSPDLIVCYGASLIKSELLIDFSGKFINLHLGLSPYYRGSATNLWPIVHGKPEFIGATFMLIDEGIDSGEIIHQIPADILATDNPHTVGFRLVRKMAAVATQIIRRFSLLERMPQPTTLGNLYLRRDFCTAQYEVLYKNIGCGLFHDFTCDRSQFSEPNIVTNSALFDD